MGGVGLDISSLRPNETPVTNSAKSSTGPVSFMHRYSNTTREVAQDGRRGALMLSIDCRHPDVFDFVNVKQDRDKVTGANISVMLRDDFMQAVKDGEDYLQRWPCDIQPELDSGVQLDRIPYGELVKGALGYYKKVRAKDVYKQVIHNAWDNAEPGQMFIDEHWDNSPDGVYKQYKGVTTNPCGEIFMGEYDACRLLASNYTSFVRNPYTPQAYFDYDLFYKVSYEQQRIADDVVDLEIEHIDRILDKIKSDPESEEVKLAEYTLWEKVKHIASASRRTGCGFTGLADTLAMLNLKYDSDDALEVIEHISRTKLRAELDCTTDLAILRGTFKGWNRDLETNKFYQKIQTEFPEEYVRMNKYGRRNVSWSTVAPTGTVSLMTQTSSGLEPVFLPYYIRRRKVNPNDIEVRIDFTDQNGDNWMEYPVLHPEFKEWIKTTSDFLEQFEAGLITKVEDFNSATIQSLFEQSPWYKSTANDIDWKKRIEMQGIIQKYVTHSISSTLNLPESTKPEEVGEIYMYAWEKGLKGVTVYRDNCRTGVLISDSKPKDSWLPHDAPKRPDVLPVDIYSTTSKGTKWNVIVGLYEGRPYEVFAVPHFTNESNLHLIKLKKGRYDLLKNEETYSEDVTSEMNAEQEVITRLVSTSLRHGADITFIVEQLNKSNGDITSFSKAIARVLSKYIDQEKFLSRATCQDCGSTAIIFEEGCQKCLDCGSSKCG